MGAISFCCAASTAPESAVSSHGYATAVGTGVRFWHRTMSASYFPVPVAMAMTRPSRALNVVSGSGFSQEEGQHDGERHAVQQRLERDLVMLERSRCSARRGGEVRREHRPQQRAEGEVEEVHDACRGAGHVRRVSFL